MNKSKWVVFWVGLVLVPASGFADHVFPDNNGIRPNGYGKSNWYLEGQINYRFFAQIGRFQPMLELQAGLDRDLNNFSNVKLGGHHLRVGSYFKAHKNLHLGLFYSLAGGLMHNDDWSWQDNTTTKEATNWFWRSTVDRFEHQIAMDVTPRFRLDIPGQNFFVEVKNQLQWSSFSNRFGLKVRPGVSWLIEDEGKPVVTLYLQNEFYFSLPSSATNGLYAYEAGKKVNESIWQYENWLYVGSLFHISENFSLGGSLAWKVPIWREFDRWSARWPGDPIYFSYNALVVGLTVVNRVSF